MSPHLPRHTLERELAGRSDEQLNSAERSHLQQCAGCAARQRALAAEREAYLARYAPAAFVEAVTTRARIAEAEGTRPRFPLRPVLCAVMLAPMLAVAAALVLMVTRPD